MKKEIKNLYHPVILEHNKNPYLFEKMEETDIVLEAYNEVCGDQFKIFLKMDGERIKQVSFHGYGCAVSKASTSVLVKNIEGKKLSELKEIIDSFLDIFNEDHSTENEEMLAFQVAKDFSGRLKCATLSWEEVRMFLIKE